MPCFSVHTLLENQRLPIRCPAPGLLLVVSLSKHFCWTLAIQDLPEESESPTGPIRLEQKNVCRQMSRVVSSLLPGHL